MLLGLDFDNTLICYDALFHRVACERALIPASLPPLKNAVRDYLRQSGQEPEWTLMQGEVYGKRLSEAEPYPHVKEVLQQLRQAGVAMCLVSHKTRVPYLGEPWDLHAAAKNWLELHGFYAETGLGWSPQQVFFELTQAEKIARIQTLGCTHYVDDLPEILRQLTPDIQRLLFAPHPPLQLTKEEGLTFRCWSELPELLGVNQ